MSHVRAFRAHVRAFGFRIRYVGLLVFRLLIAWSMTLGLALDRLVARRYRRNGLDRPVFLVGHLRSGTTFLHRFLLTSCSELRGLHMWEMLFPATSVRRLLRPLLPLLVRVSLDRVYNPRIHRTSLLAAETDDIAIAFRFSDGMLSWIYNEAWMDFETDAALREDVTGTSTDERFVRYLRAVYQRVAPPPARMLSKSFSGLFCLDSIRSAFPGAKILLLIRDPAEAVPSTLSLQRSVQGALHGLEHDSPLAKRYYRNLYGASRLYYERLHEAVLEGPSDGLLLLTHRQLLERFEETLTRVLAFLGLDATPELRHKISEQAARQAGHSSGHEYSLQEFGLSEAEFTTDFSWVYENYEV